MKTLFLSFLLFLSTLTNAQTFSEVIIDSNLTKETLYSNALSFFAATFNSANAVIQMKDPESGKVIGKGIIDGKEVMITITCKDKKYKYDIEMVMTKEINLPITKLGNMPYAQIAPLVEKVRAQAVPQVQAQEPATNEGGEVKK